MEPSGRGRPRPRPACPAAATPQPGTVSYESALGKALLGHRVGEEVEGKTPNEAYNVGIVGIE